MVYWNSCDVGLALIGGVLISAATTFHLLIKGRVTGFSGIYYSVITFERKSFIWKLSLVFGVIASSAIMFKIYGFQKPIFFDGASPAFDQPSILLGQIGIFSFALAGFLVGFGTKLGNGCTSGHELHSLLFKGVCGLPRLSLRSLVAVCTFMTFGIVSATLKYHCTIYENITVSEKFLLENYESISTGVLAASLISLAALIAAQFISNKSKVSDVIVGEIVGIIFGFGLVISGMVKRSKIIGFLTIYSNWDPSLAFVMASAVTFNLITFQMIINRGKPLFANSLELPSSKVIDMKLVGGAAIFGIGWGIGGLCPGPAFCLMTEFTLEIGVVFMVLLAIGQVAATFASEKIDSFNQRKVNPSDNLAGNSNDNKIQFNQ